MTQPPLAYYGRVIELDPDLVYQEYLQQQKASDLTQNQIDTTIEAGLSSYATTAYVDQRDALNATKAYVDAGDANRLKLADKGINNGIVPLDANGRVPSSFIDAPLTQRWSRGPWVPNAYHASQQFFTTETTLFTCPVTDPGYPYRLMVHGSLDARPDRDSEYVIFNVRVGNAGGPIIATGQSMSDAAETAIPTAGDNFNADATGWTSTILEGTGGGYAIDEGVLKWIPEGIDERIIRYRRTNPADALTLTDYQRLRMVIHTPGGHRPIGPNQKLTMCGRMNTDETHWVGLKFDDDEIMLTYTAGGPELQMLNGVDGFTVTPNDNPDLSAAAGDSLDLICGTVNSLRQYLVLHNNNIVMGAVDTNFRTPAGPSFRGWGMVAHAMPWNIFTQTKPADLEAFLIGDAPPQFDCVTIMPRNLHAMAPLSGPTTLYVTGVRSGSASTAVVSTFQPSLHCIAMQV